MLLALPVQSCFHLARNIFVIGRNSYRLKTDDSSLLICILTYTLQKVFHLLYIFFLSILLNVIFTKIVFNMKVVMGSYESMYTSHYRSCFSQLSNPSFLSFFLSATAFFLIPILSSFFGYSPLQTR